MLYFCKVGDSMEYRCPKCDAVLKPIKNIYKCEYCRSEFDVDYFTNKKSPEYIIPFKITRLEAINIYKQHIKSTLLTPSKFKNTNKIEGVYVPCYIYDLDYTGEVEFECDKDSSWKSSGTKYVKKDVYKVLRGANMSIKEMPIIATTAIKDIDFGIYNYNELIPYDSKYLNGYKSYDPDKTKDKLLSDIKQKAKDNFIEEVKKDIKDYSSIKHINNSINLYNPNRKFILLPIWLLKITYKNKEYIYIINGENGYFIGDIPIANNRCIFIWIVLFLIIFVLALVLNMVIL